MSICSTNRPLQIDTYSTWVGRWFLKRKLMLSSSFVTKFITSIVVIQVTLCCPAKVGLRYSTNLPEVGLLAYITQRVCAFDPRLKRLASKQQKANYCLNYNQISRKLMGVNLKVFWAKFSTLSWPVLLFEKVHGANTISYLKLKARSRFSPASLVCP